MKHYLKFITVAFLMALPALCLAKKKPQVELPVVRTDAGLVQGFHQEGTEAFLGIPYARVERFMPPLPVNPWDTVMVCDHECYIRNNPDRKLEEIINDHCFNQLKEFNEKKLGRSRVAALEQVAAQLSITSPSH